MLELGITRLEPGILRFLVPRTVCIFYMGCTGGPEFFFLLKPALPMQLQHMECIGPACSHGRTPCERPPGLNPVCAKITRGEGGMKASAHQGYEDFLSLL